MFVQLILIVNFLHVFCDPCPELLKRSQWNARPPTIREPLDTIPPPYVVIHHSDGNSCNETDDCKRLVRNIQDYHMNVRKWADIGYNFLIGGDGVVYERGYMTRGAHCPKYNGRSLGICLLGNFQSKLPDNKQLQATKGFINCAQRKGYIEDDYHLIGHRQGRVTLCPGDELFGEIKKWAHFDEHPS